MFFLRKPGTVALWRILEEEKDRPLTYAPVGGTRGEELPGGFPHHRHLIRLGAGRRVHEKAVSALMSWRMYDLDWTTLCWPHRLPEENQTVGVLVRHSLLWSFNPCRVVYVLDESAPVRRFGFAIGTLPGHSETGEERFTVEMREDGSVWYRIVSFARAHHPVAGLAPWAVRHYQRRFGHESLRAIARAVGSV